MLRCQMFEQTVFDACVGESRFTWLSHQISIPICTHEEEVEFEKWKLSTEISVGVQSKWNIPRVIPLQLSPLSSIIEVKMK